MTTITAIPAGKLGDGREVHRYVLDNGKLEVALLDLGVRATSIKLAGVPCNLILGYPSVSRYEQDGASMGAVVGRYANRIRDGRFQLDGRTIRLSVNRGGHHLHGGFTGFACRCWQGVAVERGVRFRLHSPDGEEGYPGNLDVTLEVTLDGDTLEYRYEATTDADTIVNMTNHSYFNLADSPDILGHRLQLFAADYLPIDEDSLPTGEIVPVEGSPFDFRRSKALGRDIDEDDRQLELGAGYDHCFVLSGAEDKVSPAARLVAGMVEMVVSTTEPAIQLYTGNRLPQPRRGVCLETQHYPDSPNHDTFPSTLLRAGATYSSITRYQFQATS